MFCVIGLFFAEWGVIVPKLYIVSHAVARAFSRSFGSNLISHLSRASIISRTFTSYFADRFGPFNMMVLFSSLSRIFLCGLVVFCRKYKGKYGIIFFTI